MQKVVAAGFVTFSFGVWQPVPRVFSQLYSIVRDGYPSCLITVVMEPARSKSSKASLICFFVYMNYQLLFGVQVFVRRPALDEGRKVGMNMAAAKCGLWQRPMNKCFEFKNLQCESQHVAPHFSPLFISAGAGGACGEEFFVWDGRSA